MLYGIIFQIFTKIYVIDSSLISCYDQNTKRYASFLEICYQRRILRSFDSIKKTMSSI